MSDAGKVLQQAEIDAIIKSAAGRAMATTVKDDTADDSGAFDEKQPATPEVTIPEITAHENEKPSASRRESTAFNEILRKLDSLTECVTTLENRIEELEIKKSSPGELEEKVRKLAGELREERTRIKTIFGNIESMVDVLKNTPGAGMRSHYTCNNCGAQGFPIIPVRCSICGEEGWWGWFSEK